MSPDNPFQVSLQQLPGVSKARLELLNRLGLRTVGDLLFHFPRTYEDLTDVRPITQLTAGSLQTVRGEVVELEGRSLNNGGVLVSVVLSDDGVHCLEGVWFNQPYAARRFRYGQRVSFSGKPRWFRDHWQMNNPRVQILDGDEGTESASEQEPSLPVIPVYPLTEDLRLDQLRPLIARALEHFGSRLVDVLPSAIRQQHNWAGLIEALRTIHFPPTLGDAQRARRRFVYEEFLLLQLGLAMRRRELRQEELAPRLTTTPLIDARIRRLFPFPLTNDQDQAIREICQDLGGDGQGQVGPKKGVKPMQRLLQADVGAGKTAVAVYALLVCVANQHQGALMAPTEVLARQHATTLERYLAHSRVRRLLLTGSLSTRERRAALDALARGEIDLVVGTQALVQEDVRFAKLGLVVIDEQHKFGVHQRAGIRKLGVNPHYLVMTATPIPRTVALTVFGDLDVSCIRQLPPGRQPVTSRWVSESQRERLYGQIREQLAQGRQGYIVCPLVEESDTLDVKAATETYTELAAGPFQDYKIALLHGRQDESTKAEVMERFRNREIDLLVSTSVVEVGVDVPNATLLIIENAQRFGLSQLHQLRGRVSRGTEPGHCYLFAPQVNEEGKQRLRAFLRTTDGFKLAEEDVRLRGVGEFFGTRQHGLGELRVANLVSDANLLTQARADSFQLIAGDPHLEHPDHTALRQAVLERYGQSLELAEVG